MSPKKQLSFYMKRPSLSKIKKFPDLLMESGSRPNEGGVTGNRKNIIFYFVDFLKQQIPRNGNSLF